MSADDGPCSAPAARPISAKPMLPIEEYAISRFRFVCISAATEPQTMEIAASAATTCCHCVVKAGERLVENARHQRDGGDLRRGGEERGDRRRRAFVDVRRPHVERRGATS